MLKITTRLTIESAELANINITNQLIAKECLRRGYTVDFLPSGKDSTGVLAVTTVDERRLTFKSSVTALTAGYGVIIARNKYLTQQILEYNHLSVPATTAYTTDVDAVQFMKKYDRIVVKPADTNHGTGITVGVSGEAALADAIVTAKKHSRGVLLQQMIDGEDHRLLVINGELFAASIRRPASVIGNGIHTIAELIVTENKNILRGEGHLAPMTKISHDVSERYLISQGKSIDDIPGDGEEIIVSGTANLSQGGIAEDITDIVHPSVRLLAEQAAVACGLGVAGVDIMCQDISQATGPDSPAYVIEVNEAPGIRMHHFPGEGQARNVAAAIVDAVEEKMK